MPFFAPIPDPDPPAQQVHLHVDWPNVRPDHWLPGLGPDAVVAAQTDTTAVVLRALDVYPRGLALGLLILVKPSAGDDDVDPWGYGPYGPRPSRALRLGLEWADGSRVESGEYRGPSSPAPGTYQLNLGGGGGGGLRREVELWLTPLPPPEPVTVHILWEPRGIAETSAVWDLAPVVARAARAAELWPLDPAPTMEEEAGWIAYGPPGAAVVARDVVDGGNAQS
jgi:hypothetical protein